MDSDSDKSTPLSLPLSVIPFRLTERLEGQSRVYERRRDAALDHIGISVRMGGQEGAGAEPVFHPRPAVGVYKRPPDDETGTTA